MMPGVLLIYSGHDVLAALEADSKEVLFLNPHSPALANALVELLVYLLHAPPFHTGHVFTSWGNAPHPEGAVPLRGSW